MTDGKRVGGFARGVSAEEPVGYQERLIVYVSFPFEANRELFPVIPANAGTQRSVNPRHGRRS
jgi:hypothetical protein